MTLLLLMSALLSLGNGLDWMGAGNWTSGNLTTLWGKINSFDSTAQQTPSTFVSAFSDELNTAWHPAWNVVLIVYLDAQNYDSILYGYGFNGHWFWANGMKLVTGKYYSLVIWKDYNCITWWTLDTSSQSVKFESFSDAISEKIRTKFKDTVSTRDLTDIWKVGQDIQATTPKADDTLLSDPLAYTVVAIQNYNIALFFKVCAKEYIILSEFGLNEGQEVQGAAVVFQMRDL